METQIHDLKVINFIADEMECFILIHSLELSQTPPRRPLSCNQDSSIQTTTSSAHYKNVLVIQHYTEDTSNISQFFYRYFRI